MIWFHLQCAMISILRSRHDLHCASGMAPSPGASRWLLHDDDYYYNLVNKSTSTLHHDLDTQAVKIKRTTNGSCRLFYMTCISYNLKQHITNHITSMPLQNKVRRLYFIFAYFTWLLGLSHKNRFLPTNNNHNADQIVVSITPLSGPSVADGITLKLEKLDTHKATCTEQAARQSWDRSQ